jgi:glycosyltransferase involved in cell wall biosynthesis
MGIKRMAAAAPEDLVSVIIPTYNRYKYMLNAVKSALDQTHQTLEVIVVNDHSDDEHYYIHDFADPRVRIIHLGTTESSRAVCGHPSAGYVRTVGTKAARGKWIAFLDDDDYWLPEKLARQLAAMREVGIDASCTEGLAGSGPYDASCLYPRFNAECNFATIDAHYKGKLSTKGGFPRLWDEDFLSVHNCVICSSVVVSADIMKEINYMRYLKNGLEDYRCWLDVVGLVGNIVYVARPLVYYDMGHGAGRLY